VIHNFFNVRFLVVFFQVRAHGLQKKIRDEPLIGLGELAEVLGMDKTRPATSAPDLRKHPQAGWQMFNSECCNPRQHLRIPHGFHKNR
jgi:hypothetical protein